MKLVRFSTNGQSPRLGVLQGDRIADLTASVAASLTRRGVTRAAELAAALVPNSTRAFLEGGPLVEETVAGIKEWVTIPANSARLHAPITDPGKFICIGLNYRDHAEEANQPIPKEPPIFAKWSNAILDPNEPILRPRGSNQLDWEVELGVVIGRPARYVSKDQALEYVAGYCIVNDVSERAYQLERGGQWDKGKGCDTFGPLGPWLVTRDEVPDAQALDMWLEVDGRRYQNGSTRTMIFGVPTLVSYVSQFMSLQPGDVISTGTPPGVGMGQKPSPVYLKAGQTMRLGIGGLGEQRQRTVPANTGSER